ncbi:MAG TPA: TolC family protein [Kofleriaceae bacterium]|nr:TolC family protein [Kofleriaceae bacterium]
MKTARFVAPGLLVVALAGCLPSSAAMYGPVDREIERRVGVKAEWRLDAADARVPPAVARLLERPLDRDAAVRIAIASNRRLQADFEGLGIAASQVAEATVLAPLEIDIEYEKALEGSGSEWEIDATQDVLGLLQLPQRRGIAGAQVRAARARAVAATVALVFAVEAGFYELVAAQQALELRRTAFGAASAGAEVVERMHRAGNTTDLDLARAQAFREEMRALLARAETEVEVRREAMNRLLGLHGESTRWTVAGRLPEPPARHEDLDDLESQSVAASLELGALRADAEAAAGRVSHARLRTILPELGLGVAASRADDESWHVGPALRIGIPLFNWQQGPRARAHAELRRAQNLLAATAVELRAAARAARQRALEAHAEAIHMRDVVLPLRERVVAETVLQYNAMNASTFELLQARRDQVDSGRQYIDSLRRFWTASAEVAALRRGVMPGAGTASSPTDDGDTAAPGAGGH